MQGIGHSLSLHPFGNKETKQTIPKVHIIQAVRAPWCAPGRTPGWVHASPLVPLGMYS